MRRWKGIGAVVCLVLIAALGLGGLVTRAEMPLLATTPTATLATGVTSEVLGRGVPVGAPEDELAVARVTIAPGASIASHEHPGTQVAAIIAGELTYTVETGEVEVTRAGSDQSELVTAGQTVVLQPGDSLVEQPGEIHHAENKSSVTVEIALASLFPAGAPRTIFVTPTP
jgi:quercetin dioxygenase-like cupin family protein